MAIITSLLLIGSVAYACSGPAGGSPPIVSSYLSVVLSASGASGNGTPNIILGSMKSVGSSFISPPTVITITNNGTMTATEVALQLSDHYTNVTFEDETWACFYSNGNVLFNEPLTIVDGYGQSAIGHLNLAPGATDSYTAVYYAGTTEATGCGGTYSGHSAVPIDGYPGQFSSTKPFVGGSDNPAAPSLTNPAEGGSITPTVTVTYQGVAGTLTQIPPTGKTVTVANSDGSFSDQLAVSGANGAVTYVVTTSNPHLKVTAGGAITTLGGPLSPGTYTVSGTDSDTHGDTGIWTYTLTVIKCALIQIPPTGKTVTVTNSGSSFSDQLAVSGGSGAVTYVVTTSNSHLKVTPSGAITTVGGPLTAGTYTVSGTDSDTYGDTGTWTFTLTVTKGTISCGNNGKGVNKSNSGGGFNDQLNASGWSGSITFGVTSSNPHLHISSGGLITTVGGPLAPGTYSFSGTDSDPYGDSGTWSYTLTVSP
ncbi:MAG: hypothetical protein ACLPKZ_02255 [Acidimicrobiales bacterium]